MTDFFFQFPSPSGNMAVIIESDEKAAYAYLVKEGEIVSDVWLFNTGETPQTIDWSNKNLAPFPNPSIFITQPEIRFSNLTDDDFEIQWKLIPSPISVELQIKDKLKVILTEGVVPGWSSAILKDGPLGKALNK